MPVETYEVAEVANEPCEISEQAMSLIDELGLGGQKDLQAKHEGSPTQRRCPYRELRKDEEAVYRLLCPVSTKVERFSAEPIPVRVLQVIAHAKDEFSELQVWHQTGVDKDPVLIGVKSDPKETWRKTLYLLARWGEELDEWPFLIKKAAKLYAEQTISTLRKMKRSIELRIEDLSSPDFSGHDFLEKHSTPTYCD